MNFNLGQSRGNVHGLLQYVTAEDNTFMNYNSNCYILCLKIQHNCIHTQSS